MYRTLQKLFGEQFCTMRRINVYHHGNVFRQLVFFIQIKTISSKSSLKTKSIPMRTFSHRRSRSNSFWQYSSSDSLARFFISFFPFSSLKQALFTFLRHSFELLKWKSTQQAVPDMVSSNHTLSSCARPSWSFKITIVSLLSCLTASVLWSTPNSLLCAFCV